jgi:6-phosphogluconolactonase
MLYRLFDTEDALAAGAAREIAGLVRRAIDARSRCTVALSGGSTPRAMHEHLAAPPLADEVRWESVELFWGDERAVPPDHADSNYRMARETLLDPLGIDLARVHRMHGEAADLDEAARAYERELREVVADEAGGMPVLDVVLLGLGADAHTASLFPGTAVIGVCDQAVVAHHVPGVGSRLTLTFPVLLAARAIVVLVAGASKSGALEAVLRGPLDAERWPAQRLREAGERVTWMVDREAAAGALPGVGGEPHAAGQV